MKTNRQDLINILQKIKPALSTKGIIEQGNTFVFTEDLIVTYNDQISIMFPFKSDIEGCLPASEFYILLSEMKGEEIKFSIDEDKLKIVGDGVKASLNLLQIDDIIIPEIPNKWNELPEDFIEGISFCIFSASKDMTNPFLTCLNINEGLIISSDNYRISQYKMKSEIDNFLLPATSAIELVKLENIKFYCLKDSWIYFKNEDEIIFCSRVVEDKYPDISELLLVEGDRLKLPDGLKQIIKTSSILAEGEFDIARKIEVNISGSMIKCKGQNKAGWVEGEISLKFDGDISFSINPEFFIHILDKATTVIIGEDKLLFRSGQFKHLISLFEDEE